MRLSKPMKDMLMAASQERHHMLTGSARTQAALVERGLAILDRRHVRTGGFEFYALTSEGFEVARSLVDAATTAHVEAVVGNILAEDDETLATMLDDLLAPVTVAEMIDNAQDEQATLIKACEDARVAHFAIATSEDPTVARYDGAVYMSSQATLLESIRAAYPDMDATEVYTVWIDCSEDIAYCVDHLRSEAAALAAETAQYEAECARITDMARSLTVPQARAILNRAPWQRDAVTSMPYSLVTADTNTMAALVDRGLVTYEQGSHRLTSLGLDVKMEMDSIGITLETLAEREQAERDAAHADDPSDADLITLIKACEDARVAHFAIATSEDWNIAFCENDPYRDSQAALMASIRAAYPDMDADAVYDVWADCNEDIAYCVDYLRRQAADQAKYDAECKRIADTAQSLTLAQQAIVISLKDRGQTAHGPTGVIVALQDRDILTLSAGPTEGPILTRFGMDVQDYLFESGVTAETLADASAARRAERQASEPTDAELIGLIGAWNDASELPSAFTFGNLNIRVGDVAIIGSRGMWRRGLVAKVGRKNVTVVYTTDGAVNTAKRWNDILVARTTKAAPFDMVATVPRGGQPTEVAPQPVTEPDAWQAGMDDLAGQLYPAGLPTEDDTELVTEIVTELAAHVAECARVADMARSIAAQGRAILDYIDEDDAPVDILTLDTLADFLAGPNAPVLILPRTDAWTRGMAALWRKDNRRTPRSRRPRGRARVGAR